MSIESAQPAIEEWVSNHREDCIEFLRDLIAIPSATTVGESEEEVAKRIRAEMQGLDYDEVFIDDFGNVHGVIDGDEDREHILGKGTHSTDESPPPFAAQFVDATVDEETGEFAVNKLVVAVDCGVAINPGMAEGQVEGTNHMSYEIAVNDGITFDDEGRAEMSDFDEYEFPTAAESPPIESILVETHEPTGPFGAKSVAEVPTNTVPPALSNAIREAVGVRITSLPIPPRE